MSGSLRKRKGKVRRLMQAGSLRGCTYLFALTKMKFLIFTRNQCPTSTAVIRLLKMWCHIQVSRDVGCSCQEPFPVAYVTEVIREVENTWRVLL